MNLYIKNPNSKHLNDIKVMYKQNRNTLSIPFNRVFDEMLNDKSFIICVNDKDELVGFCGLKYKKRNKYYEIEHLCVSEDYRRKGIAVLMLTYLINNYYTNTINVINNCGINIIANAVDGAYNNSFYDKFSYGYEIIIKKTKTIRKYLINKEKILEYGKTKLNRCDK